MCSVRVVRVSYKMAMELAGNEKRRGRLGRYVYVACQLAHVLISLSFLAAAVTEFVAESPYFDVLGHPSTVPAQDLYRVSRGGERRHVHWRRIHPPECGAGGSIPPTQLGEDGRYD